MHERRHNNSIAIVDLGVLSITQNVRLYYKRSVLRRQSRDTDRNMLKNVGVPPIRIV